MNASPGVLKLGFVGGGVRSAVGRAHASAIALCRDVCLVAGCFSRDAEMSAVSAESLGLPRELAYSDLETFLGEQASELDAVVVLSPTPLHEAHVEMTLGAGLDTICEKALSTSAQSSWDLVALAQERQRNLYVTFNYSGYPMVRQLRSFYEHGFLGEVHTIEVKMPQQGYAVTNDQGATPAVQLWRLTDGPIPTVSLDLGVHLVHLVSFITGQSIVELVAQERHVGRISQVADDVTAICMTDLGVQVTMRFGKASLGERNGLAISLWGREGSLKWRQTSPEEILYSDCQGRRSILDRASPECEYLRQPRYERFKSGHPAGFVEAFANLYQDLSADLMSQRQHPYRAPSNGDFGYAPTGANAARGLEVLEAVHASSILGIWTKTESFGSAPFEKE